jgi:hypothetical protein
VTQQKTLQVLARLGKHAPGGSPRPHQVTHRLVGGIRHPHRRQLARPVQLRQRGRIATIGLHPVAGTARDQRRRGHNAVLIQTAQLTVDAVAARAGFVAEAEPPLQALDEALYRLWRARNLAQKAHIAVAPGFSDRH